VPVKPVHSLKQQGIHPGRLQSPTIIVEVVELADHASDDGKESGDLSGLWQVDLRLRIATGRSQLIDRSLWVHCGIDDDTPLRGGVSQEDLVDEQTAEVLLRLGRQKRQRKGRTDGIEFVGLCVSQSKF
jgi:hypothetical protein